MKQGLHQILVFTFLFFIARSTESFAKIKPASIGSYTNGCLKNGVALTPEGNGYQSVRYARQRHYGHPALVRFIQSFAKKTKSLWKSIAKKDKKLTAFFQIPKGKKQNSWVLAIGDLSSKAGGRTIGNHHSHQNGLDVDILFSPIPSHLSREERGRIATPTMVLDPENKTTEYFTPKQAHLLKSASEFAIVDRIFVHPVIKRALCKMKWENRAWLKKVRPWHGHRSHFHVRLKCPKDSPTCKPQPPLLDNDGCGQELFAWLKPPAPKTLPSDTKPVAAKPPANNPPEPCEELWESTGDFPEQRTQPQDPSPSASEEKPAEEKAEPAKEKEATPTQEETKAE